MFVIGGGRVLKLQEILRNGKLEIHVINHKFPPPPARERLKELVDSQGGLKAPKFNFTEPRVKTYPHKLQRKLK